MALQIEQGIDVQKHIITLDEYERMCEAGVFDEDVWIELIRGEIVDMPPPGPNHEAAVTELIYQLVQGVGRRAIVWPQGNAISLPNSESRPQPDITVLKRREDLYRGKRPTPEDVLILIEVSDTSLKYDKSIKLHLYAEAAIPEYWLVNLVDKAIEVHKDPREGTYQSVARVQSGETIQLPGELDGAISVAEIIG
jgi:Uma2 family endonuclease